MSRPFQFFPPPFLLMFQTSLRLLCTEQVRALRPYSIHGRTRVEHSSDLWRALALYWVHMLCLEGADNPSLLTLPSKRVPLPFGVCNLWQSYEGKAQGELRHKKR
jgi:hypothetical protein